MLETIKALEQAEAWSKLLTLASQIPDSLSGDELARAYISVSIAYAESATTAQEYREALRYAQLAARVASRGSLLSVWSVGRCAALYADLGMYKSAKLAGTMFPNEMHNHPAAIGLAPWVYHALGRAYSRLGSHAQAAFTLRQALAYEMPDAKRGRIQLNLARVYARAGRVADASAAMPNQVTAISDGHLHSAWAVIFANTGNWSGAKAQAKKALSLINEEGRLYDTIEMAELALVLTNAAHALGHHQQAAFWSLYSDTILNSWAAGLIACINPTPKRKGGDFYSASHSSAGPRGHARCGLLGTVG